MIAYTPPTETDQLQFLKNIQRLLNEGSFVASYKFALLHALADLARCNNDLAIASRGGQYGLI
jgi:hypothetical protein